MLDFYLINDEQPKPSYPEQANLEFISGLNSKTFESLKEKEIIDSRFDYYSDFRWNFQLVKQISKKVTKKKNLILTLQSCVRFWIKLWNRGQE
ncbi:hypothetical protein [Aquimarina sp. SS2-1]|uniref:hypothetical protein n=1 Tax=Aquimarina besae TaxID=3342247 RepID=UPI00366D2DC7